MQFFQINQNVFFTAPPPSSPTEVLTFCCIGFLLTVSVKNQAMIFNLSPVISCSPIKFIFDISYITGSIYFACKNILLIVTCLFTTRVFLSYSILTYILLNANVRLVVIQVKKMLHQR